MLNGDWAQSHTIIYFNLKNLKIINLKKWNLLQQNHKKKKMKY